MGNGLTTLQGFDPSHIRIYKSILQIQDRGTRASMIQTVLAGPEYVESAKRAGVYATMLAYVARVGAGQPPPQLPGELPAGAQAEGQRHQAQRHQTQGQQLTIQQTALSSPAASIAKGRRNEKAMNYFQNCLIVLGLEEEVALTEDVLRSAYKRAAVKAHPDKGGSEQDFEAVTRAHAYLTDILRRVQGGRAKEGVVEAPTALKDSRQRESKDWEQVKPVRLNPSKLDMNAFNQMFEATRMPDPDDDGYGDWLKSEGGGSAPKFSGKFNRDVFNQAFEEEARARAQQSTALTAQQPQALTLAPTAGVELGRAAAGDYTAPANSQLKYTDLRNAYTTYNTITNQVADVRVEARSFDQYSAARKRAPDPLADHELAAIAAADAAAAKQESARALRAAQEAKQADDFFSRMKQLVLTDGATAAAQTSRRR